MSKKDQITGKGALTGNTRSFSMNHSRRTWGLNLQSAKIKLPNGQIKRVKVAARTLKTLKKNKQLAVNK
jgi:large subunit ribosomal protein L28